MREAQELILTHLTVVNLWVYTNRGVGFFLHGGYLALDLLDGVVSLFYFLGEKLALELLDGATSLADEAA